MKPPHPHTETANNNDLNQLEKQLRKSTLRLSRVLRHREAAKRKPRAKKP